MARFSAFTPRQSDVSKFRRVWSRTNTLLEDARESLASRNLPESAIDSIVPYIRNVDVGGLDVEQLKQMFYTRDDFNRSIRYMERILRESKKEAVKDSVQMGYYGNITAMRPDTMEGVFVEAERRREDQKEQRMALSRLQNFYGVEMEKVPVLKVNPKTGEIVQAYTRSRHKLYTYVPKTPSMRELYAEAINRDSTLSIQQPEEAPEESYVEVFGEVVPTKKAYRHVMTPREVMERVTMVDERSDMRTLNYFENYDAIVSTVLPDEFANEISGYVSAIEDLSPSERAGIYDFISENSDDAGTIEYLYLDMSGTLHAKVQRVMNFWRERVAPRIGAKVPEDAMSTSIDDIADTMNRVGLYGHGQQVYDEYQRRKAAGEAFSVTFEDLKSLVRGY